MNELIVIIANEGYVEEIMAVARQAGAKGGTMFNALGTAHTQKELKFLGLNIHPEKEVILIVTEKSAKTQIMSAIKEKFGLASKAAAILFSIPLSSAMLNE